MNDTMKKELYTAIEYCESIKADERAKKMAVDMWKKVLDKYIAATMISLEKHRLAGIQRFISYNERELPRDVFFIYIKDVIEMF